ncbi:N-acetylneuraminate synthase [Candidatus Methylobacter oryzae]|uniref:N-acetylneuraminate synthase n=1 Tax=Candidatus Methylobacter oryzae TaxID=2497749 RepID=A0ABY3C8Q1_9GAMM|nr:N-acetylneuraminate synthase [Candidatus Methylobacter oryzae]TRW92997.1 N-acetylneuraminate synthase [Candidatus Methylobacter oryzae]
MSVFIIAEAGVNHNGDLDTARRLVDAAVAAGADAVKFQTFKAENLVTRHAGKAGYQKVTTDADESQLAMLKRLELKYEFHFELLDYCRRQGIEFLSTAFDFESLDFLVRELGVNRLKIPSGEITNGPFLLAYAQTGKRVILSTGMATLGEIETALGVLVFGYLDQDLPPSIDAFRCAYSSPQGQEVLYDKVTLLHCTSEYPTPVENINLRAMDVLQQAFGLDVGYSDHSVGLLVPVVAAARGATVIEKHFTLDRALQGPDHQVSLEPDELKEMVCNIRDVEKVLGQCIKCPQPLELENRQVVRKSLVAKRAISAGEPFTDENLTLKRPGTGKSPMDYWAMLGKTSCRDYGADELIDG